MTRETYLDDAESREWILNTHAKHMPDAWKELIRRSCSAFILYGNEDSPERVDFYGTNSPMINDMPIVSMGKDQHGNLEAVMVRFD